MIIIKPGICLVTGFIILMMLSAGCTTPTTTTVPPQPTAIATLEALTPEPTVVVEETPIPPVETTLPETTVPVTTISRNTTRTPTQKAAVSGSYDDTDFLMAYDKSSRALSDTVAKLIIALAGSCTVGDVPPAFPDVLAKSTRLVEITKNATNDIGPMTDLKDPQNQKLRIQYLNYTASMDIAGQALVEAANLSINKDYPTAIRSYRDADAILANTVSFPDPNNTKDITQLRYYIGQVITSLQNRIALEKEKITNKP